MSLRYSKSVRQPQTATTAGAAKPKKGYDIVQQGIKELYPLKKEGIVPEVDIVFVPGLGAHPEDSWKSIKTGFNWASDAKQGLARDFPKSRILLYQYESSWYGQLKVHQFLHTIAMSLLWGLSEVRTRCPRRPIVFIGHSMGGLVISKAIVLADSRIDKFPKLFENIVACAFFGTPFDGAPVACLAEMASKIGAKLELAVDSKLLELMKPGNQSLRELKADFLRLATKLSPKIQLHCFFEEQPTDFIAKLGFSSKLLPGNPLSTEKAKLVGYESSTLSGYDETGLACDHRNLVRFDDGKDDPRYNLVRGPLKQLINGANLACKTRLNATRDVDPAVVNSIMEALSGAQNAKKRRMLDQKYTPSSWIPNENEYLEWVRFIGSTETEEDYLRGKALFIKGSEGRGKTSATMAVLNGIDAIIQDADQQSNEHGPILVAYFFCDTISDYSTAEDLLKSIIRQLISQQVALAPYAKQFMKSKGDKKQPDDSSTRLQMSVEHLWQTLEDMLGDESMARRVYFVINNLHSLPEDSSSTVKLLKYLRSEMQELKERSSKRIPVRWFFTSREAGNVENNISGESVNLIDLEDEKYCDQVQLELRNHAVKKIAALASVKNYSKALSYFAGSLLGKRASNSQWIDITCVHLEELPESQPDLKVRRVLERLPQDLNQLLENAWLQIFQENAEESDQIKELLRTLILTYEDPTEEELGVLAGLSSNEEEKEELRNLIGKCKPLLVTERISKSETLISFMNIAIRNHLLDKDNSRRLLGLTEVETKWQHGMMALRSLSHVKEAFKTPPEIAKSDPTDSGTGVIAGDVEATAASDENATSGDPKKESEEGEVGVDDNMTNVSQEPEIDKDSKQQMEEEAHEEAAEATEEKDGDNEPDTNGEIDEDGENAFEDGYGSDEYEDEDAWYDKPDEELTPEERDAKAWKDKGLEYIVKHWLHHAGKATAEIADELGDDDFWNSDSLVRFRWLREYARYTGDFDSFDINSLTALHIAASVGFKQLVTVLIKGSHQKEIFVMDALLNTPLHLAAWFGRNNIVEELISKGAVVDDAAENSETPLSMAAGKGKVKVMTRLMDHGADPNAIAESVGPVVNSAIRSGSREAVQALVERGVSLRSGDTGFQSPLQLASLYCDLSMFDYLTKELADNLQPGDYNDALVAAAEAGKMDILIKLLNNYDHPQECYQRALEAATQEANWDTCTVLLERRQDLNCEGLFFAAATSSDHQDGVLEKAWEYSHQAIPQNILDDSLYEATDKEKESTVQLLLDKFKASANATGEEYGTALTAAAFDGTLNIVKILLDHGAKVNDPNGWALQTAAAEGHKEVVEELLGRGADVNSLTTNSRFGPGTALQAACDYSRQDIVTILLEHKADPNIGGGDNVFPIIAAAMSGEAGILEMLVKAGAEVNVFGGFDHSSTLIYSVFNLPKESVLLLLQAGADINLSDNDGDTALTAAAFEGDADVIKFLLERGANILHVTNKNENALQIAIREEEHECAALLIERMSRIISALNEEVKSGNAEIEALVKNALATGPEDDNEEEEEDGEGEEEEDGEVEEEEEEEAEDGQSDSKETHSSTGEVDQDDISPESGDGSNAAGEAYQPGVQRQQKKMSKHLKKPIKSLMSKVATFVSNHGSGPEKDVEALAVEEQPETQQDEPDKLETVVESDLTVAQEVDIDPKPSVEVQPISSSRSTLTEVPSLGYEQYAHELPAETISIQEPSPAEAPYPAQPSPTPSDSDQVIASIMAPQPPPTKQGTPSRQGIMRRKPAPIRRRSQISQQSAESSIAQLGSSQDESVSQSLAQSQGLPTQQEISALATSQYQPPQQSTYDQIGNAYGQMSPPSAAVQPQFHQAAAPQLYGGPGYQAGPFYPSAPYDGSQPHQLVPQISGYAPVQPVTGAPVQSIMGMPAQYQTATSNAGYQQYQAQPGFSASQEVSVPPGTQNEAGNSSNNEQSKRQSSLFGMNNALSKVKQMASSGTRKTSLW